MAAGAGKIESQKAIPVEDLSEKEQIEQMRAWWSEYGNYVMGGIVVGIGIMVGIGQYRSHTESVQTEASGIYETVFEAVADGKVEDAEAAAAELFADYGSTVYPAQARLALARLYMDKGRDQDAADALQAVVDEAGDSEVSQVARLRLAKVLIYQNNAQAVVDLLAGVGDSAFAARYSETLGDAHVMLGNIDDARDAYLLAMADNSARPTVDRALVQMKLDDLPNELVPDNAAGADVAEEPSAEEIAEPADDATEEETE